MQTLLIRCRSCAGPIDPGARASLATSARILADVACGTCGKRALYELPRNTAQ